MNKRPLLAGIERLAHAVILGLALSLWVTFSVLAHAEEPRLELSSDRLNPGAVLDVRGVSFEPEVPVTLTLLWGPIQIPITTTVANYEGEFTQIIVLPADLAQGIYNVQATTFDHTILSPDLTIWGMAISQEEGEGELRDEDDGLLAPMPTYPPAPSPTPEAVGVPLTNSESSNNVSASPDGVPASSVAVLLVVVVVVGGMGILLGRRKGKT